MHTHHMNGEITMKNIISNLHKDSNEGSFTRISAQVSKCAMRFAEIKKQKTHIYRNSTLDTHST